MLFYNGKARLTIKFGEMYRSDIHFVRFLETLDFAKKHGITFIGYYITFF